MDELLKHVTPQTAYETRNWGEQASRHYILLSAIKQLITAEVLTASTNPNPVGQLREHLIALSGGIETLGVRSILDEFRQLEFAYGQGQRT
ncbi:MAG: hypothetical protein R3E01_19845 [Pirellulaceae bacterium]